MLTYLLERPRVSWRLAAVYALASIAFLFAGSLILSLPFQGSRLLGEPMFSAENPSIWAVGVVQLCFGAGALVLGWGSWRGRRWAGSVPLPRGVWLVALAFAAVRWADVLLT